MHLKLWQGFWAEPYARTPHTLTTGAVGSKNASTAWARAHLDPAWTPLIDRAQAIKEGGKRG